MFIPLLVFYNRCYKYNDLERLFLDRSSKEAVPSELKFMMDVVRAQEIAVYVVSRRII